MIDNSIPGVSFHAFGEGQMGHLVHSHDWSKTSLGPIESWPKSLKIHVSMMLALPTPAIIFWGEDQVQIYNDGYSVIMGPRHPQHLGSTFQKCWPEAFPVIDVWMKRVTRNAEVVIVDKSMIPLTRYGLIEECYFTFTFSPLRDEEGKIGGLLQIVTEITESILSNRRLEIIRKISLPKNSQSDRFQDFIHVLSSNPSDIRFALIFLPNDSASQLNLVGSFGAGEHIADTHGFDQLMMQVRDTFSSNISNKIKDIQNLIPHIPVEPWEELTQEAMALPIKTANLASPKGVVVLGISPRLKFDEKYSAFFIDATRELALALEADERILQSLEIFEANTQLSEANTQLSEANTQLSEAKMFSDLLIDNIPDMIFVKDAKDLKFVRLNKAGEELLGYSQSELIGKSTHDFFPKAEADFFIAKDRHVLSNGKTLDIPEETIHTRFNGVRILKTRKVVLNSKYLIGISEDITDKIGVIEARMAQKAAEDVAQRKSKFLDIAAHELRTPITIISMMLQVAEKQSTKGRPATIDVLARIKAPVKRLTRLITDLLEMSRLDRGLLVLASIQTDMVSLISECLAEFQIQAPERNFLFNKPIQPIEINIDPLRINQVLSNLLDNAVKYTSDGPIEVTIEVMPHVLRVSVTDHGAGIPKEEQESLFQAFSRGSSDTTIRASGLGLGLSICHGIISLHGGTIGFVSEEGQGSAFYFELPIKEIKT